MTSFRTCSPLLFNISRRWLVANSRGVRSRSLPSAPDPRNHRGFPVPFRAVGGTPIRTEPTTFSRDLMFVWAGSTAAFAMASLAYTRNLPDNTKLDSSQSWLRWLPEAGRRMLEGLGQPPSLYGTTTTQQQQRQQQDYIRAMRRIEQLPPVVPPLLKELLQMSCTWWFEQTREQQWTWALIAVNATVFGLWRIPALQEWMARHFLCKIYAPRSHTMLTATFSHVDLFHLGANMFALYNFMPLLMQELGREQAVAMYVSCGMLASLGSRHAFRLFHRNHALETNGSLGASGAIFGMVGAWTMLHPETSLGIVFLPGVSFQAEHALMGFMGFDLVCILLRRFIFDHYAHLVGAMAGVLYIVWDGRKNIWQQFHPWSFRMWRQWREGLISKESSRK